jgi:hypothetical protein
MWPQVNASLADVFEGQALAVAAARVRPECLTGAARSLSATTG